MGQGRRRILTSVAALVLLVEAGALAWCAAALPDPPAPVDPAAPIAAQVARVDREFIDRLPPFSDRFVGWPLVEHRDQRRALLSLADPLAPEAARSLARFDRNLGEIVPRYRSTVLLLTTSLLLGALALAWTAWRRPTPLALLAPLACGLAVAPILSEPLVGRDYGARLAPFVLPMLIAGGLVLLRERAALRAPARTIGRLVTLGPASFALICVVLLAVFGAVFISVGAAEQVQFLIELGAVLVANAIVHLVVTVVLGLRKIAAVLRRR
ncbi:MAG: hypothetical protein JNL82_11695 [Myxococcales bacterium]|nr:hypothetical protein [Myxococcales bacterium]